MLENFKPNDSPSQLFKASRGIQQVVPLSSFLFTLVAEALGVLLVKAKDAGLIGALRQDEMGKWSLIFNLQMILYCLAQKLGRMFLCWKAFVSVYSWLRVKDYYVQELFGGCRCSEVMLLLANTIHSEVGKLPIMYLVLPLGATPRLTALWTQ